MLVFKVNVKLYNRNKSKLRAITRKKFFKDNIIIAVKKYIDATDEICYIDFYDLHEESNIAWEYIFMAIKKLLSKGIIEKKYYITCGECGYSPNKLYDSLKDIPDKDLICKKCNRKINKLTEATELYYKK